MKVLMLMMWWSRCRSLSWGRVFLSLRSITVRIMIRRFKNMIIAKMILLMSRGGNTDGESDGNTCTSLLNRKCKFYTLGCKSRAAGRNSLPSNANTHVRAGTVHSTGQREISFSANTRRAGHPQTHFSFCTSWRKTVEHEFCMILAPRNRNFPCWNQKQ